MNRAVNCSIGCSLFPREPFREGSRNFPQFDQARICGRIVERHKIQTVFALE
jgi:hypothetical protein